MCNRLEDSLFVYNESVRTRYNNVNLRLLCSIKKPSHAIGLTYLLGKGAKPFEMTKPIKNQL